jgi:hypothetical protein
MDAASSSWEPFQRTTSRLMVDRGQCNPNRYTVRIEIAVTPTKQTTMVLSNRYTGTPPLGGCHSGYPIADNPRSYPVLTQTGFTVNPCGSATWLFYPVQKATPRGDTFAVAKNWFHARHCVLLCQLTRPSHAHGTRVESGIHVPHNYPVGIGLS